MIPCFLVISIISRDFVKTFHWDITYAISCLFLLASLQKVNANGKNQPAHTSAPWKMDGVWTRNTFWLYFYPIANHNCNYG
jgi:hypothetical protein